VHPQAIGQKYTVTFLQNLSQRGRKKVQKVPVSQNDLRARFLEYIMGRLPEPERSSIEEQLLADHDLSDAAADCEQELIDDYAMRRLDSEEYREVGLWIEASPDRVQRVAMARALLQRSAHRTSGRHRPVIAFAVAACLVAAAALYIVDTRLNRAAKTTQLATANPATPIIPATVDNNARPDIILIAAERIRGERKIATYPIHHGSPIQLQILLPGESARTGYRLRIASQANRNKALLEQDNLEAQSLNGQLYLNISLPPGSLAPATYLAAVTRQNDTLTSPFIVTWAHE
jgi:anti-sigma-K factor RskA